MALVHYLYIGHFVPEGGFIRFEGHRPCTTRPINGDVVSHLLRKRLGDGASPEAIPHEWGMSILADYIVCYVWSPPAALQFVADYAKAERATIVDMGSFSLIPPEQLYQDAASRSAAAPELEAESRSLP